MFCINFALAGVVLLRVAARLDFGGIRSVEVCSLYSSLDIVLVYFLYYMSLYGELTLSR